ncbi:hypothetical protein CDIK_4222 [Cucumispora dikerogammari]|nr:hypothetical protein CDIK_4222 [Cucumispora dikerogammari]
MDTKTIAFHKILRARSAYFDFYNSKLCINMLCVGAFIDTSTQKEKIHFNYFYYNCLLNQTKNAPIGCFMFELSIDISSLYEKTSMINVNLTNNRHQKVILKLKNKN